MELKVLGSTLVCGFHPEKETLGCCIQERSQWQVDRAWGNNIVLSQSASFSLILTGNTCLRPSELGLRACSNLGYDLRWA